eukprot:TRINITY_DN3501_c0_g1_i1.p2 TRINITY_DN3501_c0_g1~~TRINITY_DN3501_c0_g1_i1.p2  ORF type:complete len:129 (-),score=22.87 TRINITY_DN3501_c0_g1_i1:536-922(-)
MGRCPHNKAGGQKKKYSHKSARRTKFEKKGDDMVYTELRAPETVKKTDTYDEDLPGMGQYYCLHCDRHFVSEVVKGEHLKTKMHRKRVKLMEGVPPHSQLDADLAGGMGRPDNGPRLRVVEISTDMVQ